MGTTTKFSASSSRVSAKSLTQKEIDAKFAAANMVSPLAIAALPAVLSAPTDYLAQQYLLNAKVKGIQHSLAALAPEVDEALAETTIQAFKKQYAPLPADDPLVIYLQGIADRLARASGDRPFTVHVVDCPQVNAFNAGGRSMVIFKGFVAAASDEAEIACVMAHEMTHGEKRHVAQRIFSSMADGSAQTEVDKRNHAPQEEVDLVNAYYVSLPLEQMLTPDAFLSFLQGKVGAAMLTRGRFQMNSFITAFAFSRDHEAESDRLGVRMAANAGYDPHGMVRFCDKLNSYPDGDTRFYTHPTLGSRIGAIRKQIVDEGLAEKGMDRGVERLAAIRAKIGNLREAPGKAQVPSDLPKYLARNYCF